MKKDQKIKLRHAFEFTDFNGDRKEGETTLAFLKRIINPSSRKKFDWCFATNVDAGMLSFGRLSIGSDYHA